jgi:hypothetical protein
MIAISSRTDIETYVANANPGGVYPDGVEALADIIQSANHPAFGRDWEEWLNANVDDFVEKLLELVHS